MNWNLALAVAGGMAIFVFGGLILMCLISVFVILPLYLNAFGGGGYWRGLLQFFGFGAWLARRDRKKYLKARGYY